MKGTSYKGTVNINITHNRLTSNDWRGIQVESYFNPAQFIRVINNTIVDQNLQSGCRVVWAYNCTFINNTCSNNGAKGLWIYNSQDIIVLNNTANNNGDYGFLIEDTHNANYSQNTAKNNPGDGFDVEDSTNIRLVNNTADSNTGYGFQFDNVSFSTLFNNTVLNNGKHGILLTYYSSDNLITLNTIRGNGWDCIYESPTCENNIIENNKCDQPGGGGIPGFQWLISLFGLTTAISLLTGLKPKRE